MHDHACTQEKFRAIVSNARTVAAVHIDDLLTALEPYISNTLLYSGGLQVCSAVPCPQRVLPLPLPLRCSYLTFWQVRGDAAFATTAVAGLAYTLLTHTARHTGQGRGRFDQVCYSGCARTSNAPEPLRLSSPAPCPLHQPGPSVSDYHSRIVSYTTTTPTNINTTTTATILLVIAGHTSLRRLHHRQLFGGVHPPLPLRSTGALYATYAALC